LSALVRRLTELFDDLRKRRVFRAGGIYWVSSLAVLGALDLVRDLLPWLDRAFPALVLTAVLLFPVVLVGSWVLDWTPEGLRLYRPGAGEDLNALQRFGVVVIVAGATLGFGWAVLLLWSRSDDLRAREAVAEASALDPANLAVLYFDDYSPGGSLEYLANGLTDGLISALADVDGLTVTSRNGVRPFRDAAASSDSIARSLGVGTLVLGSVTGEGARVRVFAQLVDVTRGDEQLWSGRFERDESDILALQEELVEEISAELRQNLGVVVRSREAAAETEDARSWLLFQEGRSLLAEALDPDARGREPSLVLLERADSLLGAAAARDPEWAAPRVERGWAAYERSRILSPVTGFVRPADSTRLLALADEAVRRSGGAASALELRGVVRFELAEAVGAAEGLRAGAEADFQAALREDPRRAVPLAYLASTRRLAGEFGEARAFARRALEADAWLERAPELLYLLYSVNLELKAWDAADRWCREGRSRFPTALRFLFCRLQYEALRPRAADPAVAWALRDTLRSESTREEWELQNRTWSGYQVATVLARNELPDSAERVLAASRPGPADRPWFAYDEAHVRLLLGDRAGALELLESYLEVAPDRRSYLPSDWLFEELWADPRFQELVDTAGDSSNPS
jgi:TolB-like protein